MSILDGSAATCSFAEVIDVEIVESVEQPSSRRVFAARPEAVASKPVHGFNRSLTSRAHGSARAAVGADPGGLGEVVLSDERVAGRWGTVREIANDRDLIAALGLRDAEVSALLGKSRQTLNNQLGAKRDARSPRSYFKPSELFMLVSAARQWNPSFDAVKTAVTAHIEATGRGSGGAPEAVLMESLMGGSDDPFAKAKGVVIMVPDFLGLMAEHRVVLECLRRVAGEISKIAKLRWTVVLSSSGYQAKMAVQTLGLSGKNVHSESHDYVEHYLPMVVVYDDLTEASPTPYVVSARGALVPAPEYRGPMMAACLHMMLPPELRAKMFDTPAEPKPRKRAAR